MIAAPDHSEPTEQTIGLHQVQSRTGLGRDMIYRLMRVGMFPRRINSMGWREKDVKAWVREHGTKR